MKSSTIDTGGPGGWEEHTFLWAPFAFEVVEPPRRQPDDTVTLTVAVELGGAPRRYRATVQPEHAGTRGIEPAHVAKLVALIWLGHPGFVAATIEPGAATMVTPAAGARPTELQDRLISTRQRREAGEVFDKPVTTLRSCVTKYAMKLTYQPYGSQPETLDLMEREAPRGKHAARSPTVQLAQLAPPTPQDRLSRVPGRPG